MDISVDLCGLRLKNPVTVASGTAGYGEELSEYFELSSIGAIFTKGLSIEPKSGNKGNRIIETPSGVLNSIGLQNVGLDFFLREKLPFLLKKNAVVIPNVAGHTAEENAELCSVLSQTNGISAVELNVSCPNVKQGGMAFGRDIKIFSDLINKVRQETKGILIVKLSPNVTDISEFAVAAEANGADAVSAINTLLGMKIDINRRKPHFAGISAGLSGPAVRPVAVRCVYEIFRKTKIPIIGLGGIQNASDVIEFIMAGASAVSTGTMNLVDPLTPVKCIEGLISFMKKNNIKNINEIRGAAHSL